MHLGYLKSVYPTFWPEAWDSICHYHLQKVAKVDRHWEKTARAESDNPKHYTEIAFSSSQQLASNETPEDTTFLHSSMYNAT